jgi:hypothetical protein
MAVTTTARVTRVRWWPAGLAWALWALAMLGLAVLVWLDQLLRQTAQPELVVLTPTALAPVLGAVSVATVGALVAGRRPRHPVGDQQQLQQQRDGDSVAPPRLGQLSGGRPDQAAAKPPTCGSADQGRDQDEHDSVASSGSTPRLVRSLRAGCHRLSSAAERRKGDLSA